MVEPVQPTSFGEVPWLEPIPDTLLTGVFGTRSSPAAHVERVESVSLAFVTALQTLPPRQVAVPTRANGQPAFGAYLRPRAGLRHATGLYVLALAGEQISAMTRFEPNVMPLFGLPPHLPSH
ncbi:MAG: polymerase, sigma-24 subunit, subfamily [Acidimicrobiales bacterium]|nr:polymerase, sigma-24 subunit, subfamily [Acidimicrobiales bacterium]